jgi:hypothetical protein
LTALRRLLRVVLRVRVVLMLMLTLVLVVLVVLLLLAILTLCRLLRLGPVISVVGAGHPALLTVPCLLAVHVCVRSSKVSLVVSAVWLPLICQHFQQTWVARLVYKDDIRA